MSDSNSTKEQNTRVNCGWGKCVADCGIWRWPWAATASLCGAGVVEGQWGARLGGIGGSASRWGGGGKLGVLEAECGESGWTWAGAASAGAQSVARKGAFVGKRTGGAIQQTLSVVLVFCPRLGDCLIQRFESGHSPRFGPNGLFGGYLLDDGSPTIPSHRNRRQGELGEFGELGRVARPCGISRGVVHTSYCDLSS